MKIVADINIPYVSEFFSPYGELILKSGRTITSDDVKDADILLVRSITPVGPALLQDSKVKFVGSVTAGKDHLDVQWLEQAGIAWSSAGGFNAPPVGDYVVSAVAALQRRQLLSTNAPKAAIIGVGNVGKIVVERLKSLGFKLILCDPIRASQEADFFSTPLEDIADVDLVSIHVPLTKHVEHATHHFINESFLKRQKPGCVLLNASRGAVIDSKQLLAHGGHLRWCFDVWEHEPHINKAVLEQSTIATPHIAGYSVQSRIRGIDSIYRAACDKNIIQQQTIKALAMPNQTLAFAGRNLHWQDIILGVNNLLIITSMMRTLILPAEEYGHLFDDLRHQFNYRYEFAFTKLMTEAILPEDREVLDTLGLEVMPELTCQ